MSKTQDDPPMWKPKRLFAQNFEDLYLYRLFSGVDKGFYIDVGAWHPTLDNVTAIFYEQGWRGINIEPVKEIYAILQEQRSEDINLCLAVVGSSDTSSVPMLVIGDNPCETGQHCVNNSLPGDQVSVPEGTPPISTRLVSASTLREIINKYAMLQPISFLKIDIEGYEYQALLGLDLPSLRDESRPQVIVLEATLPDTRLSSPCRPKCRTILEENDYRYLFFDGLNDYYCVQAKYDVFAPLMLPPNVFDIPCVAASSMFSALDQLLVQSNNYLIACNRVSELEAQVSMQTELLEKAELANTQLAERSKKLRDDLGSLLEERSSLAAKLNTLRLSSQSDVSGTALSHARGLASFPLLGKSSGVRMDMNETPASFKLAVYVHIPKCSGTSMLLPYLNAFADRVKWHGVNSSLAEMQQGILGDCGHTSALYCGHFYLWSIESVKDVFPDCDIKYFAHFRDPIERAISYYNFISRTPASPEHNLVTEFSEDLDGWFGALLLGQSQVRFIIPRSTLDPGSVSDLMDFIRSGRLRLYSCCNVQGCASEVNLHMGINLPVRSHSLIHNSSSETYPASVSAANLSKLRQLCHVDLDAWGQLQSQGILS
jgi:FkbM family methyltransferase